MLCNSVDPAAPVRSTEAPDDKTFVIKLAFPYAPINMLVGAWRYVVVMPVEADGKFDIKNDDARQRRLASQVLPAQRELRLHEEPGLVRRRQGQPRGKKYAILPDVAANMAQFRTGNLWHYPVPQDEVLATKHDPSLSSSCRRRSDFSAGGAWIRFG